jgi:hypothetical protein
MVNRTRVAVIIVAVAAVAGGGYWMSTRASTGAQAAAQPGEVAYTWRGRFMGQAVLPATLNWCPGSRQGLLQGISTDTGIVIVLHEAANLSRGPHAVTNPTMASGVARPAATAAVRWMRDSATIVGFRSTSGTVDVGEVGETATGTFTIRMQVPGGFDTLTVRGSFNRVPVTATAVGCA